MVLHLLSIPYSSVKILSIILHFYAGRCLTLATACPNDSWHGTNISLRVEDCKGFSDNTGWRSPEFIRPTYVNNLHDFSNLTIKAKIMQDCYKKFIESALQLFIYTCIEYKWRGPGEFISCLSCDGSFSAFSSFYGLRSYVFFFSFRRAYAFIFLNDL
jgi:hypothetical protein